MAEQQQLATRFVLTDADAAHIENLPPHHKVVMQELVKGDDYLTIASTLQLPIGTVKSRINRARGRIARMRAAALGGGN